MSVIDDKNEPSRFLGEGVSFKAKLIGILEVTEARGDRMCQEALADLKMAIRAAGEHKQRISVHVAIDGLRLRDEKTGDSLYHHPVHKISFIAQDMSDSRAFGYIFGSPDTGHRFFGIKTDKAASQVVIAMRDLFQVVFELKKKEIELAKQQLEGKSLTLASRYLSTAALDTTKSLQNSSDGSVTRSRLGASSRSEATPSTSGGQGGPSAGGTSSGGAVAELVDLEQELSSLQRGLHQMERLTPPTDPFGDSFTPSTQGFLPPPPSSGRGRTSQASVASEGSSPFSPASLPTSSATHPTRPHFTFEPTTQPTPVSPPPVHKTKPPPVGLLEQAVSPTLITENTLPSASDGSSNLNNTLPTTSSSIFDVFTELDPLGTGRSKPYVDKKHFFQELKNPPKKVLKDLVPGTVTTQTESSLKYESTTSKPELLTTLTSVGRHSGGSVSIAKPQTSSSQTFSSPSLFSSDPFAETDPFDNTDPFAESLRDDPFVSGSLDFTNIQPDFPMPKLNQVSKDCTLPDTKIGFDEPKIKFPSPVSFHSESAPLQVSLPPENKTSPKLFRNPSTDSKSSIRQRPQSGKQQPPQPTPSPPPPLPPKKPIEKLIGERSSEPAPPLPLPARRRPTPSGSLGWLNTTEDDYLTPIPPAPRRPVPSPTPSQGLDLSLATLLTCEMDELAGRLNIPVDELSKMTVAQLTVHLSKYIQNNSNAAASEPTTNGKKESQATDTEDKPPAVAERPPHTLESNKVDFEANFEDNFASVASDTFVANFDNANFSNVTSNPSFDKYAAFREIDIDEFKSLPDASVANQEEPDSLSSQPDLPCDPVTQTQSADAKPFSEFNIETLTISSPSIKVTPQHNKLEELKNVISNLHKTGLSPPPDIDITAADPKTPDNDNVKSQSSSADRYAALRDLSAIESPTPLSTELTDEPVLSSPLQVPKERKRSDEKSDGFDHSDFFDCIDNSLSIAVTDDAFRKSPLSIKNNEMVKSPIQNIEAPKLSPSSQLKAPSTVVSGSISDIASGSSPEIGLTGVESGGADSKRASEVSRRRGDAWSLLGSEEAPPHSCQCSSEEEEDSPPQWPAPPHHRRHRRTTKPWHSRQTSSSSRDVSPWDEEPLPRDPLPHTRYQRERHESGGSRERRDSGGSRERRDSGSGRDRDRHRRQRRHSRDDDDEWSGDGGYSRRSGSRETRRDRGWSQHDDRRRPDERGYSTVGRREGRRRGEPPWQPEEPAHRYASTMGNRGWRRSGSSGEGERRSTGERVRSTRHHRPSPRSHRSPFPDRSPSPTSTRSSRHRDRFFDDFNQSEMDSPIVSKNGGRFRFSNDFSEKDSPRSQTSPFENDFVDNVSHMSKKATSKYESTSKFDSTSKYDSACKYDSTSKYDSTCKYDNTSKYESTSKYDSAYANLEKESPLSARMSNFRFRYDKDISSECMSGSPASPRPRHNTSPPNTARSLFEDDFSPEPRNGILRTTDTNGTDTRKETIHEGEELQVSRDEKTEKMVGFDFGSGKESGGIPENRRSQKLNNKNRPKVDMDNIKKSESVNIFARETDPFDDDDFFCTASDRPRRDNWQASFDNM